MRINNIFKIALSNILSNKLRSFLTMLGLVVGISSVILLVGISEGSTTDIMDEVSSLGSNMLTVNINNSDYSFSFDELDEFLEIDNIETVSRGFASISGLGKEGDYVVVTAGYPFGRVGLTNVLHIVKV